MKQDSLAHRVSCGTQLGDTEQRVLRGLVAHATDEYASLSADRLYGRAPVDDPSLKVRVTCTLERLAEVAGFGSPGAGPTNNVIRKSLAKLADVKLAWRKATAGGKFDEEVEALITNEGSPKGHGSVNVTFHARLQAAILASRNGEQYVKVAMHEARALQRPCARLLHHRLAHMNEGARRAHGVPKLQGYLWRGEAMTKDALKNHRSQLVKAIEELRTIGWRFDPSTEHPGCFEVVRPVANSFKPAEREDIAAPAECDSKD